MKKVRELEENDYLQISELEKEIANKGLNITK